ncbi:hypothetical protein Leryth_015920 [Lithospermum erythrorhizon]|nr:hypothetical protein Leryth_015920 [Lithospermum erythrorhizon]
MDEHKNGSRRTYPSTCTCALTGGGGGGCDGGCIGDNRSSKRLKQKKVPQRGLGVAQLEKIRLEEQHKKGKILQPQACNIFPPNDETMSPSNKFSSTLDLQCPNLKSSNNHLCLDPLTHPFFLPPSSVSLPTISSNGGSSTNSLFKPSPSMPNFDDLCSNPMTLPKTLSFGSGFDGSWPEKFNGGFNLDYENQKLDHDFDPVTYEANNPILNFPNFMQRSMTFQQPHPSSKMEPPSNQSYFHNKYSPSWQEGEKMFGLKRKYPFAREIPPTPTFHGKSLIPLVDPLVRSNESVLGSNGFPANAKPRNHMSREPSNSIPQAEQNSRNVVQENGDFLTLAPPLADSPSSNVKHRDTLDNSAHSKQDLQEASQGLLEDRSRRPRNSGSSILNGQPFFSFFPSPSLGSCDSEVGERVDLSLKL